MERTALTTRAQVADYLGVPVQTLHNWASEGTGPPFTKIGNRARYDWDEVYAWVDALDRGPRRDRVALT